MGAPGGAPWPHYGPCTCFQHNRTIPQTKTCQNEIVAPPIYSPAPIGEFFPARIMVGLVGSCLDQPECFCFCFYFRTSFVCCASRIFVRVVGAVTGSGWEGCVGAGQDTCWQYPPPPLLPRQDATPPPSVSPCTLTGKSHVGQCMGMLVAPTGRQRCLGERVGRGWKPIA